eukprot:jgi/Chlat1/1375/Chrsp119S01761
MTRMRRVGAVLLLLLCALLLAASASQAEDATAAEDGAGSEQQAVPTAEELAGMKVKELKAFLAERGVECRGCAEKADYVKLAQESLSLPVKEQQVTEEKTTSSSEVDDDDKGFEGAPSKEDIQLLINKFKEQSGDGFKIWNKEDWSKILEKEKGKAKESARDDDEL